METPTCPWVTAEDRAPLGPAPAPYAVTASYVTDSLDLGTSVNCHSGSAATTLSLSTVAPAIQAVITLNLTSSQDLTYLLAGLMDNNTTMSVSIGHQTYYSEGLNGYFLPVTGQLSTLGLSRVVMGTLANASAASGGVYGAPYDLVLNVKLQASDLRPGGAHPLGFFDIFAGIWNSFAGDFATLLLYLEQDVVGLVGIVWNAVVAATVYFAHMREGLAHLVVTGVQWVAASAVSDLEKVGLALEAALQALLAFVEAAITALLGAAIHLLQQAFGNYWRSVESPLGETENYTSQGKSPPTSTLLSVWSALGGSVFMDTMLLATVLAAVVTVILTVNLGASFVLPILLTVVITAALQESPLGTILSDLQSTFVQPLSGNTVQAVESWIDSHPLLLSGGKALSDPTGASSRRTTSGADPGWQTLIEILSVSVSISLGFKFVVNELNTCAQPSMENNIACSWFVIGAGIALEVVSIGLHLVSLAQPVPSGLHILGLIFSILATVVTGIRAYFEEVSGLRVIEILVAILGGVAIGINLFGTPK